MVTRLPQPRRHKTQRVRCERRHLGRFVVFSEMLTDLTLEAQLGDLGLRCDHILRHRGDDLLQRLPVIGKLIGRERHPLIESHQPPFGATDPQADSLCRSQPASTGCAVRTGRRQSIPSSSIDSCAGDSTATPVSVRGHTNRPRSSRLA